MYQGPCFERNDADQTEPLLDKQVKRPVRRLPIVIISVILGISTYASHCVGAKDIFVAD
jgi:hypothetical protein